MCTKKRCPPVISTQHIHNVRFTISFCSEIGTALRSEWRLHEAVNATRLDSSQIWEIIFICMKTFDVKSICLNVAE